jgi:hypothetical protein
MSKTTRLRGNGGNYVPKVLALMLAPGTVTTIVVGHDPGCGIYTGGACDCDPDVSTQTAAEALAEETRN